MEALLNFQTMVTDLTGMAIANASMLDEATAAAEAMTLAQRMGKSKSKVFFVADDVLPQTLEVRAHARRAARHRGAWSARPTLAGEQRLLRRAAAVPGRQRRRCAYCEPPSTRSTRAGGLVIVAADLLALTLLQAAGRVRRRHRRAATRSASACRMGCGGPHAAYLATQDAFKRSLPGRLVGVTVDAHGAAGLPPGAADARAAHPPREGHLQHLHRAGAAGRHRQHVRRLPRPAGPAPHRAARGVASPRSSPPA